MDTEKVYERKMISSGGWLNRECFLCGKHFKQDDQIVLIVPHIEYKADYPRLRCNAVVHLDEWEEFKQNNGMTTHNVLKALGNTKKPKKEKLTEIQQLHIQQFKEAASRCGFRESSKTNNGAKAKLSGRSDILEYNVYTDTISYSCRRKQGIFDGFIQKEIVTKAWNLMHEIRGDNQKSDYSALETINKVIKTTNEIMKGK